MLLALALLTALGIVAPASNASSAPASDHDLLMQLSAEVAADHARMAASDAKITSLQIHLAAMQAKSPVPLDTTAYGPFTVTGSDVYLNGYNLHITSGSGSTNAAPNGLGNLIIGYNEAPSSPKRTGSHNLILGTQNNYTSYGGIVAGSGNTISGIYASVVGGRSSTATGSYSCIAGGYKNSASTIYTAAVGPMNVSALTTQGSDGNSHSGYLVTFTGANVQILNGLGATDGAPSDPLNSSKSAVENGLGNLIIGYNLTHAGNDDKTDTRTGSHNLILGDEENYTGYGGLMMGLDNEVDGNYAAAMGQDNLASSDQNYIVGGEGNRTENEYATIYGGSMNFVDGVGGEIVGGYDNTTSGYWALVTGGQQNAANSDYSVVGGGLGRHVTTEYGWVAGSQASGGFTSGNFSSP